MVVVKGSARFGRTPAQVGAFRERAMNDVTRRDFMKDTAKVSVSPDRVHGHDGEVVRGFPTSSLGMEKVGPNETGSIGRCESVEDKEAS